ncbi:MAG: Biotin synthase [Deltaproteobacteria bacterium]|nr:Biotin synthase [Deltaproteobacteria bacterium]
MSLTDKIVREMEIKMDLMIEGVNIQESALEGVGTKYCEKIIFLFDYTRYGLKGGTLLPGEMMLPEGTCYMVMYDTRSPYLVRKEDGALVLEKNGKFVSTVRWNERPEY